MCPSLRGRSIAKPMGYRTLCNSICSVCPVKIPSATLEKFSPPKIIGY